MSLLCTNKLVESMFQHRPNDCKGICHPTGRSRGIDDEGRSGITRSDSH